MTERKETLQSTPCDWCEDRPEFPFLYLGHGKFRDTDYDFYKGFGYSYRGIPVCGGCGGLGERYDTEDFEQRRKRIMELRFEYFPTDDLPEPPEIVRLNALKELGHEVKELVNTYGTGVKGSFAESIVSGELDPLIKTLETQVNSTLETIKDIPPREDPAAEATRNAILAYYSGAFEEGEEQFQKALQEFPESSFIPHVYAAHIINFQRDPERALPLSISSTELEPKKALHFYNTAKCLTYLGRDIEALNWLGKATLQEDHQEIVGHIREMGLKINEKMGKTIGSLYEIATNWGNRVIDDDRWAIFFSSEFDVEPNFVITVDTTPGKQFISIASGNEIRDYHQIFGEEEVIVPLERRREEKISPLGIVYVEEKESGLLFWDSSLSLREVDRAIMKLNSAAIKKGLYDPKTENRLKLPEPTYIAKLKRSVETFFAKEGSMHPVMPDQDSEKVMQEFDHPEELMTWQDPYVFNVGGLVFIAHRRDEKFLEMREQVFNDVLIERGFTFQELMGALSLDPELFRPIIMGIKTEFDERLRKEREENKT